MHQPQITMEESVTDMPIEPQWHYTLNGNRLGPVPEGQLIGLIESKKLDQDEQIWKPGMNEWLPIRRSGLVAKINFGPPPIAPNLVKNGWAWLVAFVPLIDAAINLMIQGYVEGECEAGRALRCAAFAADPTIYSTPWWAVAIVNSVFCVLDERRLARAGYSTRYMPFLALFVVPIYLFARAKRLKQTPWHAIVWVGCFLASVALLVD
ncbi:MAG: DUF4339 domain-containing protein [Pseudomonadota bacterium]